MFYENPSTDSKVTGCGHTHGMIIPQTYVSSKLKIVLKTGNKFGTM